VAAYPLYKLADHVIIEGVIANTLLFFFITLVSFFLIARVGAKGGNMLNAFLGSMGIKMAVALVYFLVFLKSYQGREFDFAVTFFAAYLICTGFEVYYILYNLRQI
jgi:heme/copper-type cytochrome/quinol oxidase subunit 4